MFDIIFISYNEPNADSNYERLKQRFPRAKRVDGVQGIHNAHIAAAKRSFTKMFWVVDGDAEVLESFNFDYQPDDTETVYVWRSKNPINGLEYGYGGVKLLPKTLTLKMDTNTVDMTTSISDKFCAVPEVSNITAFNSDGFSTWRSAFRECAKLGSKVIDREIYEETQQRINVWITLGYDKPFGAEAIDGATQGRNYGRENASNVEALKLINDYTWLMSQYQDALASGIFVK